MPAEKKDGQTGADNAPTGCAKIAPPTPCFPSHQGPGQRSVLCRERNPATPVGLNSPERSSEFAIRCACYFSWPNQKPASSSQTGRGVQLAAGPPATSGVCKAAGPEGIEPDPQSPGECCPI